MGHTFSESQRLDSQLFHHANPLDDARVDAELPKDSPADFCLDQVAQIRGEIHTRLDAMMRGPAGTQAVFAYLQFVIRKCTEAGIAQWMEQENDQGSIARGEDAIVLALQMVTQLLLGDGDSHKVMTARQQAMRAQALLFAIGRTRKTETQIAQEFGYTRANVSAVVKNYQRKFKLWKSRGMKSDAAVEVYRERAKRVHRENKEKQQQWKTQNKHNSVNRLLTLKSSLMQTLVRAS